MKTFFHWMLALLMLVTGSINTLTTNAADKVHVKNRFGQDVFFSHPFFQALTMFLGEALCFLAFRIETFFARKNEGKGGKPAPSAKPFNRFLLAIPACCDMTATSTMYVGLGLSTASNFQMLRGSVVLFTGIMSCVFLGRKLRLPHWTGMFLVTLGTAAVGMASTVCHTDSSEARNPVLGNLLIILAQIVVAVQMVVEEKLIGGAELPALQVVGWEGIWGFLVLSIVLSVFYHIKQPKVFWPELYHTDEPHIDSHRYKFEDVYDSFYMLAQSWQLTLYTCGTVCSIAFFNFAGVSITKHLNAATRMVLDSVRTIVIWAFSLAVGWGSFCWMQVLGFVVILAGTVVFNELVTIPGYKKPEEEEDGAKAVATDLKEFAGESPALPIMDAMLTPTMGKATAMKQR